MPISFMISGPQSGRLGLQSQTSGVRGVATPIFRRCKDGDDFGVIFLHFRVALGRTLTIFGAVETGSKFLGFASLPGSAASVRGTRPE